MNGLRMKIAATRHLRGVTGLAEFEFMVGDNR